MMKFFTFGGCLHSQMRVTSNGCLDDVSLLLFFNSLIIVLLTHMTDGW